MNPTPVRLTERQKERIEGLNARYGTTTSRVIKNALDTWFARFDRANSAHRMAMIMRPRSKDA